MFDHGGWSGQVTHHDGRGTVVTLQGGGSSLVLHHGRRVLIVPHGGWDGWDPLSSTLRDGYVICHGPSENNYRATCD